MSQLELSVECQAGSQGDPRSSKIATSSLRPGRTLSPSNKQVQMLEAPAQGVVPGGPTSGEIRPSGCGVWPRPGVLSLPGPTSGRHMVSQEGSQGSQASSSSADQTRTRNALSVQGQTVAALARQEVLTSDLASRDSMIIPRSRTIEAVLNNLDATRGSIMLDQRSRTLEEILPRSARTPSRGRETRQPVYPGWSGNIGDTNCCPLDRTVDLAARPRIAQQDPILLPQQGSATPAGSLSARGSFAGEESMQPRASVNKVLAPLTLPPVKTSRNGTSKIEHQAQGSLFGDHPSMKANHAGAVQGCDVFNFVSAPPSTPATTNRNGAPKKGGAAGRLAAFDHLSAPANMMHGMAAVPTKDSDLQGELRRFMGKKASVDSGASSSGAATRFTATGSDVSTTVD